MEDQTIKYSGHVEDALEMRRILSSVYDALKEKGYKRASLAVQKANYAVRMYQNVGFKIVDENTEEYIMLCEL